MVPYLNSTNAGAVEDAEPAAASGYAQDFSGVDQEPVRAADVEYPAAITRYSKSPSTSIRCAPSRQASSSHSAQAKQKGGRVPTPTLPSDSNMQQPSESSSLQQSFNIEDPYEKLSKERSAILTEFKRLQTCIHGMEQQMAQLVDDCGALRSSLDLQMRRGQEMMEKKYNDLQLKINELGALYGQRALAENGFYQAFAATSVLLETVAKEVLLAVFMVASDLISTFKRNPSIDFDAMQEGLPADSRSTETMKFGLQEMICKVFFQGFEDPYFSLREKPVPPFQTPSEQKSALLQDVSGCGDDWHTKQLLLDDFLFGLFSDAKVAAMNQEIETRLLKPSKVQFDVESFAKGVLNPENESSIYREMGWKRAVKLVWMLQQLAMSSMPRLEIFRVGRGSSLDTTCMEEVGIYGRKETAALQKQVMFMSVPGLTARGYTVIKCRVFCF